MIEMTPEQQAQLIGLFIIGLGAIFAWFRSRLKNNADLHAQALKEQADIHEQRMKDYEANRQREKDELNIRLVEIEQNAKTEDRLFELNAAHAKSYDIVAHVLDRIEKGYQEHTNQIEIFGDQLRHVNSGVSDIADSLSTHLRDAKQIFEQIQTQIAEALQTSQQKHNEHWHTIFSEISAVRRLLSQIEEQNVKTQPIPELDDNGELVSATHAPVSDNDSSTQTNEDDNGKRNTA